jgi:hypothetical protein
MQDWYLATLYACMYACMYVCMYIDESEHICKGAQMYLCMLNVMIKNNREKRASDKNYILRGHAHS